MPQCKRCGQVTIWNADHQKETGKWVPFDKQTGEPHTCPNYNGPKGFTTTEPTTQLQQQQQQQQQPQGPTRYDSAYLIPKDDWQRMQEYIEKIDAQLTRLSEFYDSVMQEIEALRGMAFEQQNYRKHQQQLADAEQRYDRDKENGVI